MGCRCSPVVYVCLCVLGCAWFSPLPPQGGFAFKHKDNNLVVSCPEGVALSDIDGDRVKAEADALNAKKASAVGWGGVYTPNTVACTAAIAPYLPRAFVYLWGGR